MPSSEEPTESGAPTLPPHFRFGDVEVDVPAMRVARAGELVELEPRVFDLLLDLAGNAGRVVGKDEILERVWEGAFVTDNALARAVAQLRRGLGDDAGKARYIETVRRRGYRFVAGIAAVRTPAAAPGSGEPTKEIESRRQDPTSRPADSSAARPADVQPPGRRAFQIPGAVVLGLGLLAVGWLLWRGSEARHATTEAPAPVERVVLDVFDRDELADQSNPVLSPDGSVLVFAGTSNNTLQLYRRRLDELSASPIEGSENGGWATFSPDGEWLLYFDLIDRRLRKVPLGGGQSRVVAENDGYLPADWGEDGYIYYTPLTQQLVGTPEARSLWRVPADGGESERLTWVDETLQSGRYEGHYDPHLLPDRRHVLFSVGDGYLASGWAAALLDLETGKWRRVLEGVNQATTTGGNLIFWRDGELWAARLDLERGETVGTPLVVEKGVSRHPAAPLEVGQFRVSRGGHLTYIAAAEPTETSSSLSAIELDSDADPPRAATPRRLLGVRTDRLRMGRLSPDGDRLSFVWCHDDQLLQVRCGVRWMDLESGATHQFSDEPEVSRSFPIWSRDGEKLVYASGADRGRQDRLVERGLDGSVLRELYRSDRDASLLPGGVTADGRVVVVESTNQTSAIGIVELDGTFTPVAQTRRRTSVDVSPDGRWAVFMGWLSGAPQLFVLDLEDVAAGPRQLTREGGQYPTFSPDGRSLYLRSADYPRGASILRFDFDQDSGRLTSDPELVRRTRGQDIDWWGLGWFEVGDDTLYVAEQVTPPGGGRIVLVRNWADHVERVLSGGE